MDLPHTGCKESELIYFSTDKFDFTIKGKPCHPKTKALNYGENISKLSVSCNEQYDIDIFSINSNDFDSYKECKSFSTYSVSPLFYEYQNYEIIIENKSSDNIIFWHDNITLREKVKYVGKSKRILSGVLNFGSEIGFTELTIFVEEKSYLKLTLEIFPSKIDYQKDYLNIINDVNNEIYNLAFDFLKKTYLWSNIKENVGSSLTEFFSIINIIFKKLTNSIDIILKNPHHVLQYEKTIQPFHKHRKCSKDTIKWIEKNPQSLVMVDGKYIPERTLAVRRSMSYDTFENRFIKYILKNIVKRLQAVRDNYLKLKRAKDDKLIMNIELMIKDMERRIDFTLFKEVGDLYTLNSLSLVLNMAPGYKDVYKYYLMLIKGLTLNGEIFKISIKDLAVLYEYWCFIKLNSLLRNKYKLVNQDLIKIDSSGLFITLSKGKKASVSYTNPQNGEKFTVTYNPPIPGLPTVAQRPDNVLTLEKQRSSIKYNYIFDAKYRLNPAASGSDYKTKYQLPGPEEDDINTMHRYRDAIVYNSAQNHDFERTMFGAYVLFPYNNEDEYKKHKFYESINQVNVGGIPFLPKCNRASRTIFRRAY